MQNVTIIFSCSVFIFFLNMPPKIRPYSVKFLTTNYSLTRRQALLVAEWIKEEHLIDNLPELTLISILEDVCNYKNNTAPELLKTFQSKVKERMVAQVGVQKIERSGNKSPGTKNSGDLKIYTTFNFERPDFKKLRT